MGIVDTLGRGIAYVAQGGKGLAKGLAFGQTAKARLPCSAKVLDQDTLEELCVEELLLDRETGDLVTPSEAARREEERGGRGAPPLVWDGQAEEWVAEPELKRRQRRRQADAPSNGPGTMLLYPAADATALDSTANEWVTPGELEERRLQRRRVLDAMAAMAGRALPRLGGLADGKVTISKSGVAWVGKTPASVALAETDVVDTSVLVKIKEALTGSEKRAAAERMKTRVAMVAGLAAVVTALVALTLKGRA